MFKKNILPIFLLALVVVLSVFYIKQEPQSSVSAGSNNATSEEVDSEFASKRLEVLEERTTTIEELESVIASGDLADDEIATIVEQINELYYLKYTEVELEDAIVMLGFEECLVLINEYDVEVSVICDELSSGEFIEIANLVKTKLSNQYKVSVETVSKDN